MCEIFCLLFHSSSTWNATLYVQMKTYEWFSWRLWSADLCVCCLIASHELAASSYHSSILARDSLSWGTININTENQLPKDCRKQLWRVLDILLMMKKKKRIQVFSIRETLPSSSGTERTNDLTAPIKKCMAPQCHFLTISWRWCLCRRSFLK